jgi:hypothetical protein
MTTPFQPGENNSDERLRYAPRWARGPQPAANANAPPAAGGNFPRPAPIATHVTEIAPSPHPLDGSVAIARLRQSLETRPVPEPAVPEEARPRLGKLAYLAAAVVVAVGVAFGVVGLTQNQGPTAAAPNGPQGAPTQTSNTGVQDGGAPQQAAQAARPMPRLTVEARRGMVNQPIRFVVDVKGATAGAFLLVSGLTPGGHFTVGSPVDSGDWKIPVPDLADVQVVPPKSFVGTMALSVNLRLADNTAADSDVLRLEWLAPPAPIANTVSTPAPPPPTITSTPAPPPPTTTTNAPANPEASPPARQLDREEIGTLTRRGETFLANGDIVAARLLLQRAAKAGEARAALSLGATYDPTALKQLGAIGTAADIAQARAWYEKAAELGSAEAALRLRQLAQRAH